MAKPRSEKKPEQNAGGQLPLPTPRQPASSSMTRVLPMQLKVGDRLGLLGGLLVAGYRLGVTPAVAADPAASSSGRIGAIETAVVGPLQNALESARAPSVGRSRDEASLWSVSVGHHAPGLQNRLRHVNV
jgi:hypothetical protein